MIVSAWPAATVVTAMSLTTYTMDNGASATECIRVTSVGHGVVAEDNPDNEGSIVYASTGGRKRLHPLWPGRAAV